MPILDIEMFDDAPKVGDNIRVVGKVTSINEGTGEVDVSYDSVKVTKKRKNSDDKEDDSMDMENLPEEVAEEDQTLDVALGRAFPNTQ